MKPTYSAVGIVVILVLVYDVAAGPKETAATAIGEWLTGRFARNFAGEGVEAGVKRLARMNPRWSSDSVCVVEHARASSLRALEAAGPDAGRLASVLARQGPESAWLLGHPERAALVLRFGDDAATALVRHRHIAEALIREGGQPVAQAMAKLDVPAGRRLAMLFGPGQPLARAEAKPLLAVIAAHGEPAMDFIWKHKGALSFTACIIAFVKDPEPFLTGVRDLTQIVSQSAMLPVTESAREASRQINWTLLLTLAIVLFIGLVALRWRRHGRPMTPEQPPQQDVLQRSSPPQRASQ